MANVCHVRLIGRELFEFGASRVGAVDQRARDAEQQTHFGFVGHVLGGRKRCAEGTLGVLIQQPIEFGCKALDVWAKRSLSRVVVMHFLPSLSCVWDDGSPDGGFSVVFVEYRERAIDEDDVVQHYSDVPNAQGVSGFEHEHLLDSLTARLQRTRTEFCDATVRVGVKGASLAFGRTTYLPRKLTSLLQRWIKSYSESLLLPSGVEFERDLVSLLNLSAEEHTELSMGA